MRISHIVATVVAVACLLVALDVASAQAPPATRPAPAAPAGGPSPHGIAVIDVTYILEHYAKLKGAMEFYKAEAQKTEDELKKERDDIAKRAEAIKAFSPGTPEYKKLEEELTKRESDWKLKVASKRRDFAEKESLYYLRAYQELSEAVKVYAQKNGIQLVLRFNGAPIDPNNREMVQMEVFKMVMYYDKNIDITNPVLAEMNRAAGVASPPRSAAPAGPPARR